MRDTLKRGRGGGGVIAEHGLRALQKEVWQWRSPCQGTKVSPINLVRA